MWAEDDLMTLWEAVAVFWPDGPLTVASLRTEIRFGNLICERIAGKMLVTPRLLAEMRNRCRTTGERLCPQEPQRHSPVAGPVKARLEALKKGLHVRIAER